MSFKQKLRHQLAPYPRLFIPIYRLLAPERNRNLLIGDDTEIVIEGFPRSGNTFSVVAFQQAQGKEVKIAHHLHVEAQILAGVSQQIPILVLIRNPLDSLRSIITRHPEARIPNELKHYIRFYSTIDKIHKNIVLAEFEEITNDFGKVIERVNKKFKVNFSIFDHTPENVNSVFQQIEMINQNLSNGNEMYISRPSSVRSNIYTSMKLEYPEGLGDEALAIYHHLKAVNLGINNQFEENI